MDAIRTTRPQHAFDYVPPIIILVLLVSCGTLFGYLGYVSRNTEVEQWAMIYDEVRPLYWGSSNVDPTQNRYMVSLDKGRNWYAVHGNGKGDWRILGDAETIYPGLLKEKREYDRAVTFNNKR